MYNYSAKAMSHILAHGFFALVETEIKETEDAKVAYLCANWYVMDTSVKRQKAHN